MNVGVERTPQRKHFVVSVERRDAESIKAIVKSHVKPATIIYSDIWKGYNWLDRDQEYIHMSVNHSRHFKDPETGIPTNTIEGTNDGIKRCIPTRSRVANGIEEHLAEFIWRRKNAEKDICFKFVEAMRDIHYEIQ